MHNLLKIEVGRQQELADGELGSWAWLTKTGGGANAVRLWLVVGQIVPNGSIALRAMNSNVTARTAMNPTNRIR